MYLVHVSCIQKFFFVYLKKLKQLKNTLLSVYYLYKVSLCSLRYIVYVPSECTLILCLANKIKNYDIFIQIWECPKTVDT